MSINKEKVNCSKCKKAVLVPKKMIGMKCPLCKEGTLGRGGKNATANDTN